MFFRRIEILQLIDKQFFQGSDTHRITSPIEISEQLQTSKLENRDESNALWVAPFSRAEKQRIDDALKVIPLVTSEIWREIAGTLNRLSRRNRNDEQQPARTIMFLLFIGECGFGYFPPRCLIAGRAKGYMKSLNVAATAEGSHR